MARRRALTAAVLLAAVSSARAELQRLLPKAVAWLPSMFMQDAATAFAANVLVEADAAPRR